MMLLKKLEELDLCMPLNFDVLNNAAPLLIDDTTLTTPLDPHFSTSENQK